jgi:putative hemolysin
VTRVDENGLSLLLSIPILRMAISSSAACSSGGNTLRRPSGELYTGATSLIVTDTATTPDPDRPLLDLEALPSAPLQMALKLFGEPLKSWLKVDRINEIHAATVRDSTPESLWSTLVQKTGVRYEISASDMDRIPLTGPVVVVSNHPLGGLDGIILGDILQRRRKDSRLMANFLLSHIVHADKQMFFVDPFPRGEAAVKKSFAGMRDSLKHLKKGGLLGVFPGNRVSHYQWDLREVADGPWVENIASIVRRAEATVVPIFIEGGNSLAFNLAGMVHPALRTLLLPRELVRQAGDSEPVRVHVGTPMPFSRLRKFGTDAEMIRFLRMATYVMGNRPGSEAPEDAEEVKAVSAPEPVAERHAPELLEADIAALPAECQLVKAGEWEVYMARHSQLPHIMQEIGRGREISFRAAGGGTLKALDLAPQDEYYHHLFIWHREDRALVGAYRLGLSDEILPKHGPDGFICSGLFHLTPAFLQSLNPGIELGRSYVLPEYQRSYNSLSMLWTGILQFVARNPRYRYCFGSVGISQGDEYTPASRTLIVNYMRENFSHPVLTEQVESKSPFEGIKLSGFPQTEPKDLLSNVDDVSLLVTGLEPDGKGVPILIKHYLRLDAKLLSFGVWKNHSNAVVSFIIVDVPNAEPKLIRRMMGDGYEAYMKYHEERGSVEKKEG